jgi:hypothetical protein
MMCTDDQRDAMFWRGTGLAAWVDPNKKSDFNPKEHRDQTSQLIA